MQLGGDEGLPLCQVPTFASIGSEVVEPDLSRPESLDELVVAGADGRGLGPPVRMGTSQKRT